MLLEALKHIANQALKSANTDQAATDRSVSKLRLPAPPRLPNLDSLIGEVDRALKTLTVSPPAHRPNPASQVPNGSEVGWTDTERRDVIGMMRVNHVGEVCAQALYQGQALSAQTPERKALFVHAAQEEADHLAWTEERLKELGGRTSILNPLWYGGAFALGFVAGQLGDRVSLGFMAETEKQVERHLDSHLRRLPTGDHASRAIVQQMKEDEISHSQTAIEQGGTDLPPPVKLAMTGMSKLMITLAHRI